MFKKSIYALMGKAAVVLSVFMVLFSACDNKEPLPEGDGNKEVVDAVADSLVNVLGRQAKVMRTLLLEESVGVSACSLQQDGTYSVTLSTGIGFVTLDSDLEYASMVTYQDVEGEKNWATVGKGGEVAPVKKSSGNLCMLSDELSFVIKADKYYLNINGEKYETEYVKSDMVQVFACEFHKDAEGGVYAVTFDFGAEETYTYFVTSYTGIRFRLPGSETADAIAECYVPYGAVRQVVLDIPQGVEYKIAVSEGWEAQNAEGSANLINITAPASTESIAAGTLEVLTVAGDVQVATLSLSAEPFRVVTASATNVIVTPYEGVGKYVYGLVEKPQYSTSDVLSKAVSVAGGASVVGCGAAEAAVSASITELLGGEMDPVREYVLWAVPVSYNNGEAGVDAKEIRTYEFGAMTFDIEVISTKLLDAQIKVAVKGADAVFGGVVAKTEDFMSDIVYQIDNSIVDSVVVSNQNFVFEGLMSDYPVVDGYKNDIHHASTYIVWVAPAVSGDYTYTAADVTYLEVSTNGIAAGGEVALTMSEPVVTPSTFSAEVTAEGATMIYYALLNNTNGRTYISASDEEKVFAMQKKSLSQYYVKGNKLTIEEKKLNPNTTYYLFAVAVDENGKYGNVTCVTKKTPKLEYDTAITLTVEKVEVTAKKAVFKVTSKGGDLSDYIYWAGTMMDPFWSVDCGADTDLATQYMALNPEDDNIRKAMNKYGAIAADGTITIDGLQMETQYVFAILEKGETNFSKIGCLIVETLKADLGEIVVEGSAQWNAARETVKIEWLKSHFSPAESSMSSAHYAFNFSCPTNMTAYVLCGSDLYYADYKKIEDVMIDIENTASRKYDNGITPMVNGEHAQEPDYYKNGEFRDGQLMNVYEYCIHGVPQMGFVTYFAKGSHGEGNCIYWEKGVCTAYERGVTSIANWLTITPWETKAKQFGLEGQEAADWSKALLEAYSVFYKDATPIIYENSGDPIYVSNPFAHGLNEDGLIPDRVIVMLKDLQGNYYHPMYFEVPNYFN